METRHNIEREMADLEGEKLLLLDRLEWIKLKQEENQKKLRAINDLERGL